MASKGQKFKKYDIELKKKVVNEFLTNHTSLLELAYTYKIASQESILQWVKKYQKYGEAAFLDKRGVATSSTSPLKGRPKKYFDDPDQEKEYKQLIANRNKKRAAEKRRINKARKKREARKALENQYEVEIE